MDYKIKLASKGLYHITLNPEIRGFDNFISSWVFTGRKTFLVDPGPSATVSALVAALEEINVRRLDHILLTHIHVDHAGGTGDLIGYFPEARVVCPDGGGRHLEDPARLEEGTIKSLGNIGRKYGRIKQVPHTNILKASGFTSDFISTINTPGHSASHVSYLVGDLLFAGEASGVFLSMPNSSIYLRPATPARFFLPTALKSIDSLLCHDDGTVCFGHYGMSLNRRSILEKHREQLLFWKLIIEDEISRGPCASLEHRCLERLLGSDPLLREYKSLGKDARSREEFFLLNSIGGFKKWIGEQRRP